jgi:peptidoglycan/xylan/chitin deacetylase (PgdA/CDA1 family)
VTFRVALTFDAEHPDRPADAGNAERLLDALAAAGVPGSFFVQGRWAEAFPRTARRIPLEGHLVGSHSFYHARMPLLSASGLTTDIKDAETAIVEHVGVDPRPWFRFPFGTGADDPALIGRLKGLGYDHIGWHVSGDDWEPSRSAAVVASAVVDGAVEHGDGAVVLLHTWPNQTFAALPDMVNRLSDRGASFVALTEIPNPPSGVPGEHPQ